jgi:hypothetical protein
MSARFLRRAASWAAAALLISGPAHGHDTWFDPLPAAGGLPLLALGTGHHYPLFENGVDLQYVPEAACRGATSGLIPLARQRDADTALWLRAARAPAAGEALSCWAVLTPFDLELDAAKTEQYLREVAASPAVRERWAQQRAAGQRWRERYTKHARIELPGRDGPPARTAPLTLGLDIVLDGVAAADGQPDAARGAGPLRAGDTVLARVLRDREPLADQAIELRHERARVGVWLRSDAEGRLRAPLPLAGRWLLRGTELRPAPDGARWDSRFVTLVFEAAPRPAP